MTPMFEVGGFLGVAVTIAFVMLGIALLMTFIRLLRGPSLADRVVALDMLTVLAMGFIALRVIATGQALFLEIAIALGLVSFLATVFFARLIETRAGELDHGYDVPDDDGAAPGGREKR
ncbi:cation:proton antiporter [Ferruginivarius sediminum]|uniref:Cation:proton antiporter n=1 Tax=Ferruginivarius sediminum TaxID=2661937 RepID=A0A369TIC2_9PROT|nr:cation:proton antiporter [Ferruginivarius sediminum]RDD63877.1 cation:proton antiporter [Ferruginivarius sediminum]